MREKRELRAVECKGMCKKDVKCDSMERIKTLVGNWEAGWRTTGRKDKVFVVVRGREV